ncbi:MAG: prepilin-type N-terminal cleavage/methylation domain-containing protein [Eubacterium sp.]|nr:prepilin-type N-terminal cleavage/methylation domain-containing protein [Eubacterium sp.]
MRRTTTLKKNKGFSLVELIIAIAIMAILAAIIGLAIIRYINKARKQRDVTAAETIYEAASLALASADDSVRDAWEKKTGEKTFWVTTNGERYEVEVIAWARGSFQYDNRNGEFKNSWNSKQYLWDYVEEFKKNLAQTGGKNYNSKYESIPFKYRKTKDPYGVHTQYADSWIIYRRVDNWQIEVWIGYKENSGDGYGTTIVRPYFRLFPDPDKRWLKEY